MRKADYNGYEVWEDGTIISKRFKKPMKPALNSSGYYAMSLQLNKVEKRQYVHRIVAQLFVDNPDNKPEVNHKDGNKLNNHASNLEWVTRTENMQHAFSNGLVDNESNRPHNHFNRRKIAAMYDTGKYTMAELGRMFGVTSTSIFRYVEEFKEGAKRV